MLRSSRSLQANMIRARTNVTCPLFSTSRFMHEATELIERNNKIKQLCQNDDINGAINEFQMLLRKHQPTTLTFTPMLAYYAKKDDLRNMKQLMNDMGREYNINLNAKHFSIFLEALTRKNMDTAKKYFESIKDKDAYTYNIMMSGYINQINFQKEQGSELMNAALDLLKTMVRDNVAPNEAVFNTLIIGYARLGLAGKATYIYTYLMPKFNIIPSVATQNALLKAYCVDLEKTVKFFSTIENKDVFTYGTMIGALFDRGYFSEGLRLFRYMLEQQITPNTEVLNSMITGYVNHGESVKAAELIREMKKEYKVEPDIVTWNSLLQATCQKDINKGLQMLRRMSHRNRSSYIKVIVELIKNGKGGMAFQEAKRMMGEGITPNAFIMNAIMVEFLKHGRKQNAEDVYNHMKKWSVASDDTTQDILQEAGIKA
jgi:pentatricopeptide repeat protein